MFNSKAHIKGYELREVYIFSFYDKSKEEDILNKKNVLSLVISFQ